MVIRAGYYPVLQRGHLFRSSPSPRASRPRRARRPRRSYRANRARRPNWRYGHYSWRHYRRLSRARFLSKKSERPNTPYTVSKDIIYVPDTTKCDFIRLSTNGCSQRA